MEGLDNTVLNDRFMPSGYCLLWQPELVWMHALADLVIAISYISIPVIIFFILHKRKNMIPFSWVIVMFASFIFLCGLTHLMELIGIWHAYYYLEGMIKILTAAVSMATAVLLIPLIPVLLKKLALQEQKNIKIKKDEINKL